MTVIEQSEQTDFLVFSFLFKMQGKGTGRCRGGPRPQPGDLHVGIRRGPKPQRHFNDWPATRQWAIGDGAVARQPSREDAGATGW